MIPQSNLPTLFLLSMIYIDKLNSFVSSFPLRHNFQSSLVTFRIKQQIWLCKLKHNTSHIKTVLWNEKWWLSKLNSYTNYKITPTYHISKLTMSSKSYSEYRKIEPQYKTFSLKNIFSFFADLFSGAKNVWLGSQNVHTIDSWVVWLLLYNYMGFKGYDS